MAGNEVAEDRGSRGIKSQANKDLRQHASVGIWWVQMLHSAVKIL